MSEVGAKTRLQRLMQGDGNIRNILLCGMAELIGSAILMLLACGGAIATTNARVPDYLQLTLNVGFAVMIVIQIFGHISGAHVNPAITVGAVILRKKNMTQAAVHIVAQYIGTLLGYGLLRLATPSGMMRARPQEGEGSFCVTALADKVSSTQGLFVEFLATLILLLVAGAVWDQRNHHNHDSAPLRFGLTVTCLATVFGPYTGCIMNPAMSFAPAIWNGVWQHQWIYWLGPYAGAVAGAFLYKLVFGVKEVKKCDLPEAIALNHIDGEKPENV
ncbi:aquaporin AQPAe.a [Diachasma alloeum]|uniref:aquaporin AQPAe.a n=1 Tax=Diachasma alloeum TaxID=454923 RepID=UPI00073837CA|nr:aquaporin AQPAe.a [Diachasma alloeum]